MISAATALLMILVAAATTFLTRAIPFLLFGGKREVPQYVRYLGGCLPSAIIATLVIYCLKGITFDAAGLPAAIAQLLGVAAVAVLHLWKKNTLLSIGGGTAIYMVLLRVMQVV